MRVRKHIIKSDLKKIDRHRIAAAEYGDAPELTREQVAKAIVRRRGRPLSGAAPKEPVTMRLDRDVLRAYRATGKGWQSRINADLQKASKRLKTRFGT
jgi:uncharacterized protein (DUF4415 family)